MNAVITPVPPTAIVCTVGDSVIGTGGGGCTVKAALFALGQLVRTTVIGPVIAPLGTVVVICVSLLMVNDAVTLLLNRTAVTPVNPTPVRMTVPPTGAAFGETALTAGQGMTVNVLVAISAQSGLPMAIGPVIAPAGTVAVMTLLLVTVNCAVTPFENFTLLTPVKLLPLIRICAPTTLAGGSRLLNVGHSGAVNSPAFPFR